MAVLARPLYLPWPWALGLGPWALALAMPSRWRSNISDRSCSATAPRTYGTTRPVAVSVSRLMARMRGLAPLSLMRSTISSKGCIEQASRSSFVAKDVGGRRRLVFLGRLVWGPKDQVPARWAPSSWVGRSALSSACGGLQRVVHDLLSEPQPMSDPFGSAARMSVTGRPSSCRTMLVPRTSATIL